MGPNVRRAPRDRRRDARYAPKRTMKKVGRWSAIQSANCRYRHRASQQDQAADALPARRRAPAPTALAEAAAKEDQHDRHGGERRGAALAAAERRELLGRLVEEALEAVGTQNFPALSRRRRRRLRRHQYGVEAGRRDLIRQALAVAHVALQRRAMAVEEYHHDGGASGSKSSGERAAARGRRQRPPTPGTCGCGN